MSNRIRKSLYIEISAKVEQYENRLNILDPNNNIEAGEINIINNQLNLLLDVIKDNRIRPKLRLIKNE